MDVVVISTGAANLASVGAALRRMGVDHVVTEDPGRVRAADRVILPGVGAFAPAIRHLRDSNLDGAILDRVARDAPVLAVCLGLQLLAGGSDEAPGEPGLGVLDGIATRFPDDVRCPHVGWNAVSGGIAGWAYFTHSYRLTAPPGPGAVGWSNHGGRFVAAVRRGGLLATQFHPELSGSWGRTWLRSWLDQAPIPAADARGALAPRIVPCLDVRDGRVVKGVQFQGLRDAGDPVACASRYEAEGADELVMLDVSATPEGRANAADTVARVRSALSIPLTVGGGIRSVADASRLLDAGADKVSVNTAAVRDPVLVDTLAARFGRQCVVVAVDAARQGHGWEVVTRSGTDRTGRDAVAWAQEASERGAGEILLTSWDRDGTKSGYDLRLLRAVCAGVSIPVIASGGAAGAHHLLEALDAGASAVLAASIFHDREVTVAQMKQAIAHSGREVRP